MKGFDAYIHSSVPVGSGLSSSAAYEVLLGNIVNSLFAKGKETALEIAIIGRHAENAYFGKPCGLMDQVASSLGGVQFIDFGDPGNPKADAIPFDLEAAGYGMCIVDCGADHADLSADYASIPEEMSAVARVFGKQYLAEIDKSALLERFGEVRRNAGDRAALRALHFMNDNARARAEATALRKDRFTDFLALIRDSGRSSLELLQNITLPGAALHQDLAVYLAVCEEALGGIGAHRVHGGGFAGTIQAFVPPACGSCSTGIHAGA